MNSARGGQAAMTGPWGWAAATCWRGGDPCQRPQRVGDWLGSPWTRSGSYGQNRPSSLTKPTTIEPRTRPPTRRREPWPKAIARRPAAKLVPKRKAGKCGRWARKTLWSSPPVRTRASGRSGPDGGNSTGFVGHDHRSLADRSDGAVRDAHVRHRSRAREIKSSTSPATGQSPISPPTTTDGSSTLFTLNPNGTTAPTLDLHRESWARPTRTSFIHIHAAWSAGPFRSRSVGQFPGSALRGPWRPPL